MIKVKVGLDNYGKSNHYIEYKDITIRELLTELNIDLSNVGAVLVDGVPKKYDDKLKDNTEVYVLPALQGG
ncbi:MAG: MoaD/ThiS family protein [Tissierellia bacterium]|nr:MoaD/ThiS family protein [Tissierellia bacterium]